MEETIDKTIETTVDDSLLYPNYCNPLYVMPNLIEVRVNMSSGEYFFNVAITKCNTKKVYLGGFRNKVTGYVYHNASTQTPTENKNVIKNITNLRSRETQTYEYKTLSIQSYRENGTQMTRNDLLIDNKTDKILTPKNYFTSLQLIELKIIKCIIIQRCYRGYRARVLANNCRKSNIQHQLHEEELFNTIKSLEKDKKLKDMNRRINPINNKDFEILYNELNEWRTNEANKIKLNTTPGEERIKLMNLLLANETKSLQSIQKLKVNANNNNYNDKTQKLLELMSKPYKWQLSNGTITLVQTQATTKANELLELFNALCNTELISIDERLNVLYKLKQTIQIAANDYHQVANINKNKSNSNISLLKDIIDLIDREGDMLNRGRPIKSLELMRKRLQNLFLAYIENPIFNPRAIEFINVPKANNNNNNNSNSNLINPETNNNLNNDTFKNENNEFNTTQDNIKGSLPIPPSF